MSESAANLLKKGNAQIGFLESRLLLQFLTQKTAAEILGFGDSIFLNAKQCAFWESAIARRLQGEPFFYILGEVDFGGLVFKISPEVLIPRPETEELLFCACDFLKKQPQAKVLDLGTGSGILAICLKKRFAQCAIFACDFSESALKIAQQNAQQNAAHVRFFKSSWFEKISDSFDLIVANPPYIAENDSHLKNLTFEPQTALVAKNNGLADLFHIIQNAPKYLNSNGALFLEHGHDQQIAVQNVLENSGFCKIFTRYDLSNLPRVSGGFLR